MLQLNGHAKHTDFESLRQQSSRLGNSARSKILWIACTDVVMDQALTRVRHAMPAIVLRRFAPEAPGEQGKLYDDLFIALFAVEELGVRDIVICGHSMCSGIPVNDREILDAKQCNVTDYLLHRTRLREALNLRSQDNLIRQLAALETCGWAADMIHRGDLTIHAAFYLAESGIFTRYDPLAGKFVVLDACE